MLPLAFLLAVEESAEAGGLFDINATLPLVALQFVILVILLNTFFYKPLGQAIDSRNDYVLTNLKEARERLAKAEKLAEQYEQELAETRREAQLVVANAQAEAQEKASGEIASAQQEAQVDKERAALEISEQKQQAMSALEAQVDDLSRQILSKLLREVVNV